MLSYFSYLLLVYIKSSSIYTRTTHEATFANIPFIYDYHRNDLLSISEKNNSQLKAYKEALDSISVEYTGNECNIKNSSSTLKKTLENSEGYYVILMDNQYPPVLLFDFFEVSDDSFHTPIVNSRIKNLPNSSSLKKNISQNMNIYSKSNDVYFDQRIENNEVDDKLSKLYFVIFRVSHKLTEKESKYNLHSKIDLFRTFEISKDSIFTTYRTAYGKYNGSLKENSVSPQQFLISWLTTSFRYRKLTQSNIKIQKFENHQDWLGRNIKIETTKLKVVEIENNKKNRGIYKQLNHSGQESLRDDKFVDINLGFSINLSLDSNIKMSLKFKVQYYSSLQPDGKTLFRNENGRTFVDFDGNQVGTYNTMKVSRINGTYVDEFLNGISNTI